MSTPATKKSRTSQAFQREVFTISRELEYFTADELIKQTGYGREDWWPGVIAKELLDNALDASELADVSPAINVHWDGRRLEIRDNGVGIPPKTVERLTDFSTRTSDKLAYVSPTRGAQGNAWKTILAMPYVLDGDRARPVVIEACGVRHELNVRADQVERRPRIDYRSQELSVKSSGTAVVLERDQACLEEEDENPEFLPKLIFDYALFNPHATFRIGKNVFDAGNPEWSKWSPRDPTPPSWYTAERFEELVASYVAAGTDKTVRDFLATFRGLKGTRTRMQVLAESGLARGMRLEELADRGRGAFDEDALGRLLSAMCASSQPPQPQLLGVIGKEYFAARLQSSPSDDKNQSYRYARQMGTDGDLPYVVEAAFFLTNTRLIRGLHVGLNWSVPIRNPLQAPLLPLADGGCTYGLEGLLRHLRVDLHLDPVALVLHIAMPRFEFCDRGKGNVALSPILAGAVAKTVSKVTRQWASIKKARDRERSRDARRREEFLREGKTKEISIREAAFQVMDEAYLKASGGGTLPAHARQVMYAARPRVLEMTGKQTLDDDYFTQTLLPDYMREHPQQTATWDVVYDERGHLIEPHTGRQIGIGTLSVRRYLAAAKTRPALGSIEAPDFSFELETNGPLYRYGGILFIEKEGFFPLLKAAQIGERYDLAIMSTKGMGSTSARQLIERLADEARIFVLHDFDKSGFSIAGILSRDTDRFQFTRPPEIIDLGVRLKDVEEYELQGETVDYPANSDPAENLRENGATDEEIEFLTGKCDYSGRYHGRRVELNAFTSDQFIEWLEAKLRFYNAKKVIPEAKILAAAYRRSIALHELNRQIQQALPEIDRTAESAAVPENLRTRIAQELTKEPRMAWDKALHRLSRQT